MRKPNFEIREVLKPGTRKPFHYELYVDGVKVQTRKGVRPYRFGALEEIPGRGWRIHSMRMQLRFDAWVHRYPGAYPIVAVKKAKR